MGFRNRNTQEKLENAILGKFTCQESIVLAKIIRGNLASWKFDTLKLETHPNMSCLQNPKKANMNRFH